MKYATLANMGRHFLSDDPELRADFYRWLVAELLRKGHRNVESMTLWELTHLCEVRSGGRLAA